MREMEGAIGFYNRLGSKTQMKTCVVCNVEKDESAFSPYSTRNGNRYRRGKCRACTISYRDLHPDYRKNDRARSLRYKYGMTVMEYERLLKKQKGRCAICSSKASNAMNKGYLVVDHCHTTGKLRGLLCHKCNIGLGHFSDRPDLLYKAVNYLEKANDK